MIYPLLNKLKFHAIKHPMVNMSSIGDISLYDNRADIKYPFVNLDVVNSVVVNGVKTYLLRIYVIDRQNDPIVAYNKCEVITDNILKDVDQIKYNVNYFNFDFQDDVHGVYVDFNIETNVYGNCTYIALFQDFNILLEDGSFVMQENGDLISLEN